MAGQAFSTSQCHNNSNNALQNVLLYLPNQGNAHQRLNHAPFQQNGEIYSSGTNPNERMYPTARAYAKKVLASQGVFNLDTPSAWNHHRPIPPPQQAFEPNTGNYLTGDVSHVHLAQRHAQALGNSQNFPNSAYQFANMQGLHPSNVVTTVTLDPNLFPPQFCGPGANYESLHCVNVSQGPRTNSRCDSVRSEAAESSCSSLSADSQSDYSSSSSFNHQLNQSWYSNYRIPSCSANANVYTSSAEPSMVYSANTYAKNTSSSSGSSFLNRPYTNNAYNWPYPENNQSPAGPIQQRYVNYAWNQSNSANVNVYARNQPSYWTPQPQRRDVNQNDTKEWTNNAMQSTGNVWTNYSQNQQPQQSGSYHAGNCGSGYHSNASSSAVVSLPDSQPPAQNFEDNGPGSERNEVGGAVRTADDVTKSCVTPTTSNMAPTVHLGNTEEFVTPPCQKGAVTPWRWERTIVNNAVVYISPSGTRLHCSQEVGQYIQQNGTCKCGLPCPLRLEQVFEFNPMVSCNAASSPPSWEFCSHSRARSGSTAMPITTTTSAAGNESEKSHLGSEEVAPPTSTTVNTSSMTPSSTLSGKSQKTPKRSAIGTPSGPKAKKLKLVTPSSGSNGNHSTVTPSSAAAGKRRSPCPNVDVRQLPMEYNRPPMGGYLASLTQPRSTSSSNCTGNNTSTDSNGSPKTSLPSFLEDPSGYLAQQTVLLHSTIACQPSIDNEKLTFSPNKNLTTSTPVKSAPVVLASPSPPASAPLSAPSPSLASEVPESAKNTITSSEMDPARQIEEPEAEPSEFIGDLLDCIPDSMELSSDGLSANESKDSGYKSFAGLIPSSSPQAPPPVTPVPPVPTVPSVPIQAVEPPPVVSHVPVLTPPNGVSTTHVNTPLKPSPPKPSNLPTKTNLKVKAEKTPRKPAVAASSLVKKARKSTASHNLAAKLPKPKKLTPTTPQAVYTATGPFMGGVNPTNCWGGHAFASDRLTPLSVNPRSVLPTMSTHSPMVQVLNVNGTLLQSNMDNSNVILQAPPSFIPSTRDSTGGRCIMPRIEAPPGHPSATPLTPHHPPSKPARGKKRKSAPQTVASMLHGVQNNNNMNHWSTPAHAQVSPPNDLQQQLQAATCLPIPFSGGQMGSINSNVPTLALMPDGKTYVVLNHLNPQPQSFNSGTITLNTFNTVHSLSTLQGQWLLNPSVNMNPLITTANLNLSLVQNQGVPTFVLPQGVIVNQLPDGTLVSTDPNVQLQIQNVATMLNHNNGTHHHHSNALLSPQTQVLRTSEPPRPGLPGGAMSKVKVVGGGNTGVVSTTPVPNNLITERLVSGAGGFMRQATATQTSRSLSPDSQTPVTSTLDRDGSLSRGEATPPGLSQTAARAEESPVVQSCLIDSCVTEESPGNGGRSEEMESDLDDGISSSKVRECTRQLTLQTLTPLVMAAPVGAVQQIV